MLGVMFILETFFMLAATVVAFLYRGSDVYPLLISSGILFGTGFLFYSMGFKANEHSAGRREGMLIVTLTWILFSLFGMLPFYIGGYIDNVTDAFFETMSGFTTTGSTILTNIETLPKGILFWRSLTQWQGGIGMVVFTVALMPIFGGGASQMFDAETPGITHERFRPRITQVAKRLWGVYVFLTLFLVGLLWAGPMNLYDAVNHAFTAISTGGYSTKNASIAYWNSSYIEYVITIFMFIGATNMTLVYFCFNGNVKKLIKDEEFRWFFFFVCAMEGARTGRRRIAPQAISPVGCCLARGSQSSGMSTVVAAASFDPNGNQSKNSPACRIVQAGGRYARKQMMSFYGLWPMPPSSVRVSPDIYLKSGMASWTQTRPISVSALP